MVVSSLCFACFVVVFRGLQYADIAEGRPSGSAPWGKGGPGSYLWGSTAGVFSLLSSLSSFSCLSLLLYLVSRLLFSLPLASRTQINMPAEVLCMRRCA